MTSACMTWGYKPSSFKIENEYKNIVSIELQPMEAAIPSNREEWLEEVQKEAHYQIVTGTQQLKKNRAREMERILNQMQPYIDARNKIIDNPIKYLFLKKRLKKIDAKLDALEHELYTIEIEGRLKDSDLKEMILSAEKMLQGFFQKLNVDKGIDT